MSILVALPPVTIGLFAGAYADRHDRRRIMLVSDRCGRSSSRGLVVVAPKAIPRAVRARLPPGRHRHVLHAARMAMVPRVVPESGLLAANSLSQATRMVAGVIGAAVTGVVAAVAGQVWPVFLVDAATFLASALLVLGVTVGPASRARPRPRAVRAASGGAVLDGLRVIARSRPLIAALAGISVTMLGVGAINVLFIPFLVDELGASPAWAGPLEAAQTVSMILAGALVAGLATRVSVPRLFVGGIVGVSACVGLLSIAPGPWALLLIMFAVGLVRDAGPGDDDDARPAGDDERHPRPGRRRAQRHDPDGVDRVDGRRRDPRGRRRDADGVRAGGAVALLAAVVAAILFRGEAASHPATGPPRPDAASGLRRAFSAAPGSRRRAARPAPFASGRGSVAVRQSPMVVLIRPMTER